MKKLNRRKFLQYNIAAYTLISLPTFSKESAVTSQEIIDSCTEIIPDDMTASIDYAIDEYKENSHILQSADPRATSYVGKQWNPKRKVLYVDFIIEPNQPDMIINAAKGWESSLNIKFKFGKGSPNILIDFSPYFGHRSLIGTDSHVNASKGIPSMNFGWGINLNSVSPASIKRTVLHEFGHALSLIHEHQHPEAGIPWNKPRVYEYYSRTQNWDTKTIDRNIFKKYGITRTNFTTYDPESIMHYPIHKSLLLDPAYSVHWNNDLSKRDKQMAESLFN